MSTVADYRKDIVMLLRETFEGMPEGQDYTWFVQGREAFLDALEKVTPEQASRQHGADSNSIGAHLHHVRSFLYWFNCHVSGQKVETDWEGTWKKQAWDAAEWSELRADLKTQYEDVVKWLEANEEWAGPDGIVATIAILPHSAYHLGAVRTLMKVD